MESTPRKQAPAHWVTAVGTRRPIEAGCAQPGGLQPEAWAQPTRSDAVELPKRQVLHLVLLEAGRAGTVDGGHGGVGVCQPLHQPLHLAVTVKGIAPEVSGW